MGNSVVLGLNQHYLEELVKGHVCTHVPVHCYILKKSRSKDICSNVDAKNQRRAWNTMCLRTRKFSKTDGDIPKLCRGWHNRLLLATFFFQE